MANKQNSALAAAILLVTASAASAAPHPGPGAGPGRGPRMMGPPMVLQALMQASNVGPSRQSVKSMQMVEVECMNRLKITPPSTFTTVVRPNMDSNAGRVGPRNLTAAAVTAMTYDMVKQDAIAMLNNATAPLDAQMQMVDTMLTGANDAMKAMAGLNQQQMKDMLVCMHTVGMLEPLQAEKKGITMTKRLTCEVSVRLQNQSVDSCPKA